MAKERKVIPDFQVETSSSLDYELHEVRVLLCSLLQLQHRGQHRVNTGLSLSIFELASLKHSMIYSVQKSILKHINEFFLTENCMETMKGFLEIDKIQSIMRMINNLLQIRIRSIVKPVQWIQISIYSCPLLRKWF